jgi:hypothetical protein
MHFAPKNDSRALMAVQFRPKITKSVISHQSSVISHHSSVISHQSSFISHQSLVIVSHHQSSSVISPQSSVISQTQNDCSFLVLSTSYKPKATSYSQELSEQHELTIYFQKSY